MRNNRNKIFCSLYGRRVLGLALKVSLLLVGSPIAGTSAENQNADRDWHVMCLNGDWGYYSTAMDTKPQVVLHNDLFVEGGRLIRFLGKLSKDKDKDKDKAKYIVINHMNDPETLIRRDCSKWNDCSRPIFLPKLSHDPGRTKWIEEAFAYPLASMHRMRGIPQWKEGIASIKDDGQQICLKEIKQYMKDDGAYSIKSSAAETPRTFSWGGLCTSIRPV